MNRFATTLGFIFILSALQVNAEIPKLISKAPDPYYFGMMSSDSTFTCNWSANGNFIAYSSESNNLIANDNNATNDIFVFRPSNGQLKRLSQNSAGIGGDGYSQWPSFSSNGEYLVFRSDATNLVANDTNNKGDIFRYNTLNNVIERASLDSNGQELPLGTQSSIPSISSDGNLVLFFTNESLDLIDTNNHSDAYIRNMTTGELTLVTIGSTGNVGDADTYAAAMSGDGSIIAFESIATDLVSGDDNGVSDLFIRDTIAGTTTRVLGTGGSQGGFSVDVYDISEDGTQVLFGTFSNNYVLNDTNDSTDLFVYNTQSGIIERVSVDSMGNEANGASQTAQMDASGRYITFESKATNLDPNDSTSLKDVFLHDRQTGVTQLVNYTRLNNHQDSLISAVSPCIAAQSNMIKIGFRSAHPMDFDEDIYGLYDIFARNMNNNTTTRITNADLGGPYPVHAGVKSSLDPSSSNTGRYIAFSTNAQNLGFDPSLLEPDKNLDLIQSQIIRLDQQTGLVTPISLNISGKYSNSSSDEPSINSSGTLIGYSSYATDLVADDTNNLKDIFVSEVSGQTYRVNVASDGSESNGLSIHPAIASQSRIIAFESSATNLVTNDNNNRSDIFIHELDSAVTERVSISTLGVESDQHSRSPAISQDGRYVVFENSSDVLVTGDTNNSQDIFMRDRQTNETVLVSLDDAGIQANGGSSHPDISANGRYVVFQTSANNLVQDDTNAQQDIYRKDMQTGQIERISLDISGAQFSNVDSIMPKMSSNGQFVAFITETPLSDPNKNYSKGVSNQVFNVYVRDLAKQMTRKLSDTQNGDNLIEPIYSMDISDDGSTVLFATESRAFTLQDNNNNSDIYGVDIERFFKDSFED